MASIWFLESPSEGRTAGCAFLYTALEPAVVFLEICRMPLSDPARGRAPGPFPLGWGDDPDFSEPGYVAGWMRLLSAKSLQNPGREGAASERTIHNLNLLFRPVSPRDLKVPHRGEDQHHVPVLGLFLVQDVAGLAEGILILKNEPLGPAQLPGLLRLEQEDAGAEEKEPRGRMRPPVRPLDPDERGRRFSPFPGAWPGTVL